MSEAILFRRGVYHLNPDPNFNFQLNRLVNWDGGDLAEVAAVAGKIRDSASWKRELIALGDRAMEDERKREAAAYYRMGEFFMYDGDPDKQKYYRLGTELFYEYYAPYFKSGTVERLSAPYEGAALPVLHVKAEGEKKDVVLLHGGNDSYMEELFFPMLYFAQKGFEVYLFEGPGQGGVLREQGLRFTPEWERPVGAVLDAFGLDDVTIIGASLGGMLAPRAAAFEPRIQRVIGWSIFPNFLSVLLYAVPKPLWGLIRWMLRHDVSFFINRMLRSMMKKVPVVDWGMRHGMFAYQGASPFEYLKKTDAYQMVDIGPMIHQDVLVLGASEDHFIAPELYKEELDALSNVRSLTFRLFTAHEDGQNHCNCGNAKLCLDSMARWIEGIKGRDEKE